MTLIQGQPLLEKQVVGGRCKIIKQLGAGNFGETYLAEDLHAMNTKCAVKRLTFFNNDPATFAKAKDLFKREAEVLYKLTHPHTNNQIPQFFGYFNDKQEFYLVQELIEGHPLSDELWGGRRLEEEQVIELLLDVLGVLKFIHSQKIIHRDIKPENLMRRSPDGKLVLVDFGAVKEVVARSVFSGSQPSGTKIFTDGYAPREQRQGDPKPNSDIYALGMTAIQALTGFEPKDLPEERNTGNVIWRDKAQVSDRLAKILDQMVRDDCQKRYQLADEVLEAVQKVKNTLVVAPGQGGGSGVILPPPLWLLFAILAPIVMIVSFGFAFLLKPIDPTPRVSEPNYREETTNPKSLGNPSSTDVDKSATETKPTGEQKSESSATIKDDSQSESGLQFKRSQPKQTPASQSPTPTNVNDTDMPIRFKRATPKPIQANSP